jgi:hypothetical protein
MLSFNSAVAVFSMFALPANTNLRSKRNQHAKPSCRVGILTLSYAVFIFRTSVIGVAAFAAYVGLHKPSKKDLMDVKILFKRAVESEGYC